MIISFFNFGFEFPYLQSRLLSPYLLHSKSCTHHFHGIGSVEGGLESELSKSARFRRTNLDVARADRVVKEEFELFGRLMVLELSWFLSISCSSGSLNSKCWMVTGQSSIRIVVNSLSPCILSSRQGHFKASFQRRCQQPQISTNAQWKLVPQVTYRDGFRISSQGPAAPDHGGAQGGVVPKATVTACGGRGLLNFGFHRMGLVSWFEVATTLNERNVFECIAKCWRVASQPAGMYLAISSGAPTQLLRTSEVRKKYEGDSSLITPNRSKSHPVVAALVIPVAETGVATMVWGGGSGLLGKVVRPHREGHWVVSDSSPSPGTDGRCKIVWYCIIFDRDTIWYIICSYLLEWHLLKVYVSFWGVYRTYLVTDAGIPNPWPHTKDVGFVGKFSTKVLLSWPCFQAVRPWWHWLLRCVSVSCW